MYLGAIAALTLDATTGLIASAAGTEVDLKKYFVNPGKREMEAIVIPIWTASDSATASFDYKIQEAATTVDSDFSDVSGATITQVVSDAATSAFQRVAFFSAKRYVRGYRTISGGVWNVSAALLTVRRDA